MGYIQGKAKIGRQNIDLYWTLAEGRGPLRVSNQYVRKNQDSDGKWVPIDYMHEIIRPDEFGRYDKKQQFAKKWVEEEIYKITYHAYYSRVDFEEQKEKSGKPVAKRTFTFTAKKGHYFTVDPAWTAVDWWYKIKEFRDLIPNDWVSDEVEVVK